jgi:hypothetical protein
MVGTQALINPKRKFFIPETWMRELSLAVRAVVDLEVSKVDTTPYYGASPNAIS